MDRSIRILAISVLTAIAVLAAGVTWQQAIAGPGYRDDPRNLRTIEDQADRKRGRIVTADGVLLARSERREDGTYLRTYPRGDLYGHVTGYSALRFPDLGIEAARATDLTRNGALTTPTLPSPHARQTSP